jgi:hypothetical protein
MGRGVLDCPVKPEMTVIGKYRVLSFGQETFGSTTMTAINEAFGHKTPTDERLDFADMRRRIKAIFIGSVGNLVEWYDFFAYAAFAFYFAAAFFPNNDPVGSSSTPRSCSRSASWCARSAAGCSDISPTITGGAMR